MSKDWYLTKSPLYIEGEEEKRFTYDRDCGIEEVFTEDNPFLKDIVLCKGNFNGENFEFEFKTKGIVQSNDSDTTLKSRERQLLMLIGILKGYQYVKYENGIWLIMTKPSNNNIYEKVTLNLCNWIGKWQNDELNIVYKPFYVLNASQYNNGETNVNKIITIGSNQFAVYACMDEETLSLERDKRMFIDYTAKGRTPIPYGLTRNDTISTSDGDNITVFMIFTEDLFNPQTDRIDLMLCDYKDDTKILEPIDITFNGNPEIRCGGQAKTFTANTNKEVIWNLKTTETQKDFISISPNGNKVKVKCNKSTILIGTSFKLICTVDDVASELLINIVGGV